jgi:hypothetical protein
MNDQEYGDEEEYGDATDPSHPDFFACLQIELEDAKNAATFYKILARAIRHANALDQEELDWIAEFASTPWKGARGRPANREEISKVFFACIFCKPEITKADAIRRIAKGDITGKCMDLDAARKLYAAARAGKWMRPQRGK